MVVTYIFVMEQELNTHYRLECKITDHSTRFIVNDRNFGLQYAHLYAARLFTARQKLQDAARLKWGMNKLCV